MEESNDSLDPVERQLLSGGLGDVLCAESVDQIEQRVMDQLEKYLACMHSDYVPLYIGW